MVNVESRQLLARHMINRLRPRTPRSQGLYLGLGNRVKAQVLEGGNVIRETPWGPNLILDQGMDGLATKISVELFTYCAVGTGNTPTDADSGAVTATTSGATCTASGAFFAPGDVGKLLRFDTGEKAYITAYTSSTVVTLGATLGVVGATAFTLYDVAQTALATEVMRSATYVTTAGACFTSRSGSTLTTQRTFDFPAFSIAGTGSAAADTITVVNHGLVANDAVVLSGGTAPSPLVLGTIYYARDIVADAFKVAATPGGTAIALTSNGSGFTVQLPRNFAEVGFSDNASAGTNLNMRALFAGGAVTVLGGQQVRVVYQFQISITPTTPRAKTYAITGWPSLEQAVTADNTTNLFTLSAHGFTANMPLSFTGTTAPSPLVFGTTYYARDILTNTFAVSATPGGSAIDLTTDGSNVFVKTNLEGDEQTEIVGLSAVTSSGIITGFETHYTNAWANEPGAAFTAYLSTDGTLRGFPLGSPGAVPGSTGLFKPGSLDAYTGGSFTRTKRAVFGVADGLSSAIRSMGYTTDTGGNVPKDGGTRCVFDQKQEKNNISSLTLVFRWTWDRVFL
jgi:hypothetical protein